jgi:hypothetical protein
VNQNEMFSQEAFEVFLESLAILGQSMVMIIAYMFLFALVIIGLIRFMPADKQADQ